MRQGPCGEPGGGLAQGVAGLALWVTAPVGGTAACTPGGAGAFPMPCTCANRAAPPLSLQTGAPGRPGPQRGPQRDKRGGRRLDPKHPPRKGEKAQGTAQGPVPTPQEAAEAPGPGCTYRTWCSPGKQRGPPGPWASRPGGRARHPRQAARAPPGCPRHRGSRQHWRWGPAPGGGGWSLGRQSEPGTVTHADGHLPALTAVGV